VLHRLIRLLAWVWTRLLNDRARTDIMWWLNARFTVGVAALIFDDAGRVLLVSQGARWTLPGGRLRRHDTPEAALIRCVAEQTGLWAEVIEPVSAEPAGRSHLEVVYGCRLAGSSRRPDQAPSSHSLRRPPSEAGRCRWCHPADLPPGLAPRTARLIARATPGAGPRLPVASAPRS